MKPHFLTKLINDPLGDPGMMVHFLYERRALLFDLGDLSSVSNSELLKVSHIFVSHTHIDHFIGFDRLLRVVFGRGETVHLFGPENFIANVEGKLSGFTWNLVDRYSESVTLEVTEVRKDRLLKARFRAIDRFRKSEEREGPLVDGRLVEEPGFVIRTAILEHRVPCLGFALEERFHVNVRKDRLEALNYPSGAWLNKLKQSIFEEKPEDHVIQIPSGGNGDRETTLGRLKEELVLISPGQKIGYVVDTVYNESNKSRIVDLVRDADIFFCEAPFLAEEEDRALERCHLTSKQAGLLAREARVRQLRVFHFSGRHTLHTQQLVREAEDAFREPVDRKTRKVV